MESKNIGKVVQIVGAVVDVRFEKDSLPDLLNAIEIDNKGEKLVVEVAQHIGDDIVRCIAMGSTDGLVRGIDAVDTGKAISFPAHRVSGVLNYPERHTILNSLFGLTDFLNC